ncbi:MAG TPA: amidase [Roseiflexaceae bacterium]|nr:amidase [Roseiflexaceae bacterium]
MSTPRVPDQVIDQLRGNLRAAGILANESDIQGIVEKGFLSRLIDIERAIEQAPIDVVPDYLASWGDTPMPSDQPPAAVQRHASPIAEIAAQIRARQISPVELTEQALAQIAEHDPELNAFQLVLAEQARAAAQRAEREIAAGEYRGPLHGVPVAVKDLLAMHDTATTGGSKILADNVTDFDAAAVERLHAAGAVIVGKTRLSEFAYSPGSNNAHYGPTRNPRQRERDTGGSSSGSASAVGAGLVYAAIGSDTGGSIRIPAALCGIVGLKPTFGRISLHGVLPLAWSLDHLGPLTRSVADAALLLECLAGYDARDTRTRQTAHALVPADLDQGVRGLRIGVLGDDGSGSRLGSDAAIGAWRHGLAALEQNGAELVQLDLPELEPLRLLNSAILAMEASSYHHRFLSTRLDDYGEFMRQRILAAFAYRPGALVRAQQARATQRQRCNAIFERIDLLSTPSQPDVAPSLGSLGSIVFTAPFNLLGWPAISVPCGTGADNLPFGLQLVGKPWDEATVLSAARVVEASAST